MAERDSSLKILSDNRQAGHNYFLMDRFEAGMVLTGTEVKAAKDGKIQLKEAYVNVIARVTAITTGGAGVRGKPQAV